LITLGLAPYIVNPPNVNVPNYNQHTASLMAHIIMMGSASIYCICSHQSIWMDGKHSPSNVSPSLQKHLQRWIALLIHSVSTSQNLLYMWRVIPIHFISTSPSPNNIFMDGEWLSTFHLFCLKTQGIYIDKVHFQ
jgi:hypothetical protein